VWCGCFVVRGEAVNGTIDVGRSRVGVADMKYRRGVMLLVVVVVKLIVLSYIHDNTFYVWQG
jgi:hypothetical protein